MKLTDLDPEQNRIHNDVQYNIEDLLFGGFYGDEETSGIIFPPVDDNGRPRRRGVFGGKRDDEDDFKQHKKDVEDALRYYDELSNGNQASNKDEGR